ncbi:MAG: hypothetical protein IJZ59_06305 [Alphaproteobacteria bacterium]|nr:hypothetical protein [Alphaproteobacteria bacterium]
MQIPKIIHYFYDDIDIWEKGKNPQIRMCMLSWKKYCPDYKIMLWHDKHPEFKQILKQSLFVRKAYQLKLWAFVSDYVRLYALYKYGGIYLDTDVQLLKNFDMFLNDGLFMSIEGDTVDNENIPESAIIGAIPQHPLIENTMKFYQDDSIFFDSNPIAPVIMKKSLNNLTGFTKIPYISDDIAQRAEFFYKANQRINDIDIYRGQQIFRDNKNNLSIYPCEYFCPSWFCFKEEGITDNTVSIHWNQSSWWQKDVFEKLRNSIRPKIVKTTEKYKIFSIPVYKKTIKGNKTKISVLGIMRIKKTAEKFKMYFLFIPLLKIKRKS